MAKTKRPRYTLEFKQEQYAWCKAAGSSRWRLGQLELVEQTLYNWLRPSGKTS